MTHFAGSRYATAHAVQPTGSAFLISHFHRRVIDYGAHWLMTDDTRIF